MSTERERDRFEDLPILGELRDRLEAEFRVAGDPRRHAQRRRRWFSGRARLIVVVAAMVLGGGSAIAAELLSAERSAPLSGLISQAQPRSSVAASRSCRRVRSGYLRGL